MTTDDLGDPEPTERDYAVAAACWARNEFEAHDVAAYRVELVTPLLARIRELEASLSVQSEPRCDADPGHEMLLAALDELRAELAAARARIAQLESEIGADLSTFERAHKLRAARNSAAEAHETAERLRARVQELEPRLVFDEKGNPVDAKARIRELEGELREATGECGDLLVQNGVLRQQLAAARSPAGVCAAFEKLARDTFPRSGYVEIRLHGNVAELSDRYDGLESACAPTLAEAFEKLTTRDREEG